MEACRFSELEDALELTQDKWFQCTFSRSLTGNHLGSIVVTEKELEVFHRLDGTDIHFSLSWYHRVPVHEMKYTFRIIEENIVAVVPTQQMHYEMIFKLQFWRVRATEAAIAEGGTFGVMRMPPDFVCPINEHYNSIEESAEWSFEEPVDVDWKGEGF